MANQKVKALLKALLQGGRLAGSIQLGSLYREDPAWQLLEGSVKPRKEYYTTFRSLGVFYPADAVLNSPHYHEPLYLYEL